MKKLLLQFLVVIFVLTTLSACSYGSQIDGIWEANVNGVYFVVQYSGNQYCVWLNNQLAETGIFITEGYTIIGRSDNNAPFENAFQLSDDLNHLLIVQQDGSSAVFRRMQNNQPPAMRNPPMRPRIVCSMCGGSGICQVCFGKK